MPGTSEPGSVCLTLARRSRAVEAETRPRDVQALQRRLATEATRRSERQVRRSSAREHTPQPGARPQDTQPLLAANFPARRVRPCSARWARVGSRRRTGSAAIRCRVPGPADESAVLQGSRDKLGQIVSRALRTLAGGMANEPTGARPLVSADWLAAHLGDPISAPSTFRWIASRTTGRTCPAQSSSTCTWISPSPAPAGDRRRQTAVPRPDPRGMAESLSRWGVAPGNASSSTTTPARTATRSAATGCCACTGSRRAGPRPGRRPGFWQAESLPTTAEAFEPQPRWKPPSRSSDRDPSLIATANEVLEWSREASLAGRPDAACSTSGRIDEFLGTEVAARPAAAGSRGAPPRLHRLHRPRRPAPARRRKPWPPSEEPA